MTARKEDGSAMRLIRVAGLGLLTVGLLMLGVIQPVAGPTVDELMAKTIEQLDLALQQAVFAHVRFPLQDLRIDAQAVINVLEGRQGPDYHATAPYTDPGDGMGVVSYVQQLRQAPEVEQADAEVRAALENISLYIQQAIEHSLKALTQRELGKAQAEMRQAMAFLSAVKGREAEQLIAVAGLLGLKVRVGQQGPSTTQSNK